MLESIKNTLNRGVAAASVKSESFVESARLKNGIAILEKEYANDALRLGETVYRMNQANRIDLKQIRSSCAEIDKVEEKIAEMKRRLEELKREGDCSEKGSYQPGFYCTRCGAFNSADAQYCASCGVELAASEEKSAKTP